jgi:formylglycine-generating enzyme required for sulfatase activity
VGQAVEKEAGKPKYVKPYPQKPQLHGAIARDWVISSVPSLRKAPPQRELLTTPFTPAQAAERQKKLAQELKLKGPILSTAAGGKLVLIPPGVGFGGQVRVLQPFLLGQHPVTQAEFQKIMDANPSFFKEVKGEDNGPFPVEQLTRGQMLAFCNRLSVRDKLPLYYRPIRAWEDDEKFLDPDQCILGGPGYRLPTEEEWEYACRAGTTTAYATGDTLTGADANVDDNRPFGVAPGKYLGRTCKVGSYAPNAFGLYDMHGNVWQVCAGDAARGGSWNFAPEDCRVVSRLPLEHCLKTKMAGFRVARSVE